MPSKREKRIQKNSEDSNDNKRIQRTRNKIPKRISMAQIDKLLREGKEGDLIIEILVSMLQSRNK